MFCSIPFLIKTKPLDPIKRKMGLSFPSEDLEDSLGKRVEDMKRDADMYKDFVRKMYGLEDELDLISVEDQKSIVESAKRRRRSTTLDVDEILYAAVDEAAKDLRMIEGKKDTDVFIENSTLNVKGRAFTKGDKIKVTINKEVFAGAIISIGEEDVILKTKDYKRVRILLDDIRSTKSSIVPINEVRR
ncbi:hypothetical protein KMI_11g16880 [Encephalitozoon hellem]|nr:hypothetical protein KMI_11g16880 [Encephalitozoon hellem]